MFEGIRNAFRSKRLADPDFGELRFSADGENSCWEGDAIFPPTGGKVMFVIYSDEAGPQDSQRAFYREMVARYNELFPSVASVLVREAEAATRSNLAVESFTLGGITLPRADAEDAPWELDYSLGPHNRWIFAVHMEGWQLTGEVTCYE